MSLFKDRVNVQKGISRVSFMSSDAHNYLTLSCAKVPFLSKFSSLLTVCLWVSVTSQPMDEDVQIGDQREEWEKRAYRTTPPPPKFLPRKEPSPDEPDYKMEYWKTLRYDEAYADQIAALLEGFWGPDDVPPICTPYHRDDIPGPNPHQTLAMTRKWARKLDNFIVWAYNSFNVIVSGVSILLILAMYGLPVLKDCLSWVLRKVLMACACGGIAYAFYSHWKAHVRYHFEMKMPIVVGYYRAVLEFKVLQWFVFLVLFVTCLAAIECYLHRRDIVQWVKDKLPTSVTNLLTLLPKGCTLLTGCVLLVACCNV